MTKARNDPSDNVSRFCLALEEHRRTDEGRVRSPKEFVDAFFSHDDSEAKDQLFVHMPRDVRGPILSRWGIRGTKAALRDDDEKVRSVVHDALVAGDVDEASFEEGVTPQTLIDWVPLPEWWRFWRSGRLTRPTIQKALDVARSLGLFDDTWLLSTLEGRGGKLKGTDVICDSLSKDQIIAWVRSVHASGDASPRGLVTALGWETLLAKTSEASLLAALDAFARRVRISADIDETTETKTPAGLDRARPPVKSAPPAQSSAQPQRDSGLPVAIPDVPVEDGPPVKVVSDEEPASIPSVEERGLWGTAEESPKLAEARAKMMAVLEQTGGKSGAPLDWPEGTGPAASSDNEPPPSR